MPLARRTRVRLPLPLPWCHLTAFERLCHFTTCERLCHLTTCRDRLCHLTTRDLLCHLTTRDRLPFANPFLCRPAPCIFKRVRLLPPLKYMSCVLLPLRTYFKVLVLCFWSHWSRAARQRSFRAHATAEAAASAEVVLPPALLPCRPPPRPPLRFSINRSRAARQCSLRAHAVAAAAASEEVALVLVVAAAEKARCNNKKSSATADGVRMLFRPRLALRSRPAGHLPWLFLPPRRTRERSRIMPAAASYLHDVALHGERERELAGLCKQDEVFDGISTRCAREPGSSRGCSPPPAAPPCAGPETSRPPRAAHRCRKSTDSCRCATRRSARRRLAPPIIKSVAALAAAAPYAAAMARRRSSSIRTRRRTRSAEPPKLWAARSR